MSKSSESCLGCLGSLVILGVLGSMLFGGGFMMKIGPLAVGSNRTLPDQDQSLNNYFSDLENNKSASEGAVKVFHAQIGQGQCKEVYDQANERLKKNQTQEGMIKFCNQLKEKLGEVKTTQLMDWWVRPGESAADKYILLRFTTMYSKVPESPIGETFIWLIRDGKPSLISYEVVPASSTPAEGKNNVQS
jgi:hypothetical protein